MKSARLPLIILSLLCIVFLLFAVQQYLGAQKERNSRIVTEKALEEVNQAKENLQKELNDQKKVKADLEMQVTDFKGKIAALQEDAMKLADQIAEERKAKEEAIAKLNEKTKEIENLKTNFDSAQKGQLSLQEEYDRIDKEYTTIQEELKSVKAENDNLIIQLQQLETKKEVELDKIVVKPGAEAEGKVLVVNKEFNFIVVAAGNNKGVTPGATLNVFRNGKLIGKAQVEKVYETMSAANIMPDGNEIKEGDIAKVM